VRILVVEDEPAIAEFVERGLRAAGYTVDRAGDGEQAERLALTGQYDLVLLDILLPGGDGLEVLDAIRSRDSAVPVVLLTAKGEIEDKVRGLDRGANDYVVKPFSMDELLARVRAQLRRPDQRAADVLEAGDLRLDLRTRQVERAGLEIRLTTREFELLAYLMRHPGQVLSREQILNGVWGFDYEPGTNVLEVYVNYLRNKLRSPTSAAPIETVRGAGYRLIESGA
jgi:two-component system copper resistance phosphate regulon response regulator CusR